jgi:hypothetical protein
LLKADFHIHTSYSADCHMSLEQIIARCSEVGINCIAVTDHGTIEGALKMQQMAPFKVIIGEEILTSWGEIIGLFLKETIPSRLPAPEAISRVKAQGGLVGIPHPFDRFRFAMKRESLEKIREHIDFIEVFNSRAALLSNPAEAKLFACQHRILVTAGSDAHTLGEVGNAYVEMPDFDGRQQFLAALAAGKIVGRKSSPWVHLSSTWARLKQRFLR